MIKLEWAQEKENVKILLKIYGSELYLADTRVSLIVEGREIDIDEIIFIIN